MAEKRLDEKVVLRSVPDSTLEAGTCAKIGYTGNHRHDPSGSSVPRIRGGFPVRFGRDRPRILGTGFLTKSAPMVPRFVRIPAMSADLLADFRAPPSPDFEPFTGDSPMNLLGKRPGVDPRGFSMASSRLPLCEQCLLARAHTQLYKVANLN